MSELRVGVVVSHRPSVSVDSSDCVAKNGTLCERARGKERWRVCQRCQRQVMPNSRKMRFGQRNLLGNHRRPYEDHGQALHRAASLDGGGHR